MAIAIAVVTFGPNSNQYLHQLLDHLLKYHCPVCYISRDGYGNIGWEGIPIIQYLGA